MSVNAELLLVINGWAGHNAVLDAVMVFCASALIYIIFAVAVVLAGRAIWKKQWRQMILFLITLALAFIFLQVVSQLYVNNRPFVDYDLTQLVPHEAGRSFASNHTAAAFATAFGVFLFFSWRIGVVLLAGAALIGLARVFAGIHYPVDIAGAIFVALAAGGLVWGIHYLLQVKSSRDPYV